MTKINIFKSKKRIDLETLIDSRMLICANSGGGKSYAARKLLEETHGKVMSIILDVEGEFKTLREKYDFLLVGEGGDVPLSMRSAHLLPEKLLELNVSTIIDISELKRSERIQYVKKFLEALMESPRRLWRPCLVVLDETHTLCGQQEKQDSTFSVIDLMTRGRKRGFCGVLCTQRIAKLHKDAVAECNNLLIGRTVMDIDMKRAAEILGFTNKKDMLSLRDLDAGEFFTFGTAISKRIEKERVAHVKTTHPKVGMDLRGKIVPPTLKIKKLLKGLADLPHDEEKKIQKLRDYRDEIVVLKKQLSQGKIDPAMLERSRQDGFNKGINETKRMYVGLEKNVVVLERKLDDIAKISSSTIKVRVQPPEPRPLPLSGQLPPTKRPPITHSVPNLSPPMQVPLLEPTTDQPNSDEYKLSLAERKIYTLLFAYPDRTFSRAHIGVFTGYSYRGGGFNNALSRLKTLGLITRQGDTVKIKEVRSDLAQGFDFSKGAIISKLGKCEREIYQVLLDNPHEEFSKEDIASRTPSDYEPSGGGFSNSISKLSTLGIIIKDGSILKLNPELLEI